MASLARNAVWLTISKTLSVAIYALFGLVLPRYVDGPVNGVYTLLSTLLFFGSMAASFGIPPVIVRTIARDPGRTAEIAARGRAAMLGGALVSSVLVLAYLAAEMSWQGEWDSTRLLLGLLVAGILLFDSYGALAESLCQAHEEMAWPAAIEGASGLFRAGGAIGVLLFFPEHALPGIFGFFLVGSAARAFLVGRRAQARFLPDGYPKADLRSAVALLRESLGVATFRVLRMVRNRIDSLLLGLLLVPAVGMSLMESADYARALYGQAMRVVFVFHTLTLALNTAVFPRLARLGSGDLSDPGEARESFLRVVRYQAWWAAPLAAVVFVYADGIAGWFGAEYRDGFPGVEGTTGDVLRVLSLAMLLDSIGGPVGMLLIGRPEMDKRLPVLGGALALTSVALNLVLLPRYGIVGAAFASLGASTVEILLKTWYVQRYLGAATGLVRANLPYLVLAAGLGVALAFGPLGAHPLLGAGLGALVYLAATLGLGLVDPAIRSRLARFAGR